MTLIILTFSCEIFINICTRQIDKYFRVHILYIFSNQFDRNLIKQNKAEWLEKNVKIKFLESTVNSRHVVNKKKHEGKISLFLLL